jgi:hypothetical protein
LFKNLIACKIQTTEGIKMRVSINYNSYNQRWYGRPWIGKITSWPVGGKPEIKWGGYLGDDSGGEVEINAEPGDIIRSGQKRNKGTNTINNWYYVDGAGNLMLTDAKDARKIWEKKQMEKQTSIALVDAQPGQRLVKIQESAPIPTVQSMYDNECVSGIFE